jgi:hypothetical protein
MSTRAHLPDEVVRTGAVRVALPPDEALELFTAAGEERWVPGWRPVYVTPPDGAPVEGGIWLTEQEGEQTIWRVQRFDRAERAAEYLRVTPGNRLAVVEVLCAADAGGTIATVTYRVVPLGDPGRRWLEGMDEAGYAAMMAEWERLIAAHLAAR